MIPRWTRTQLTFDRLVVALLFLAILTIGCLMPAQNDTWWHLRVGREMWRSHSLLLTETFSFTAAGASWPNHEWLTDLSFYGIYSVGGMPLLTLVGSVLTALAWTLSWSLMTGPTKWRALLVGLALPAFARAWSTRPQLVTLSLLPLVMWCLLRRRLRWLPAIFVLWANLHGGFMLGLTVLTMAAAAIVVTDRARWRALLATVGFSALATLVNPLGVGLWRAVFQSIEKALAVGVTEYRPPHLLAPEDLPFWIFVLLLIGLCIGLTRRLWTDPSWPLVATSLLLIPVALTAGRNIPPVLLLMVPAISHLLMMARRVDESSQSPRRQHQAVNAAILLVFVGLAGCGIAYAWVMPMKRLQWEPLSPDVISAVTSCPERLYNRYDDGGYLLWFVPSRRIFIDSRQDPYPLALLQEHLRDENAGDYKSTFARYGIHCAFLPPSSPVADHLRRDGWLAVYQDSRWLVLTEVDVR